MCVRLRVQRSCLSGGDVVDVGGAVVGVVAGHVTTGQYQTSVNTSTITESDHWPAREQPCQSTCTRVCNYALKTRSSAMAEGPRNALVIEKKACNRWMTLAYTQGHHSCCY